MTLLLCTLPVVLEGAGCCPLFPFWGASLEGVCKYPPPSRAVFACLPKPHHLVWLKSGLRPITTCLRPFWWLIVTLVRNGPFSRIFYTPPSCWNGGSSPFLHPFCTLCAPFVHAPFCARTPFLHPVCTHFLHWNPLSAPFLGGGGGFCAKDFCKKCTKCIHRVQICLLKRTCNAFFLRSLVASSRASLCRAARCRTPHQGSPCSIHG